MRGTILGVHGGRGVLSSTDERRVEFPLSEWRSAGTPVVGQVVGAAVEQVVRAVRPEAAVAVAAEFTFPLALALAVLAYLVIQGQFDRRDPKLRVAPQNVIETLVTFKTEEEL